MTALIVLLTLCVVALAVLVAVTGQQLRKVVTENTEELRTLRLDSRARVSTVSMRTGADPEAPRLRQLRRLGRQAQGKRVVVGGDPESDQHQALLRGNTNTNPGDGEND